MTTKKAAHTPGPWSKEDDVSEDLANARLIAAAPELLAACKAALAAWDWHPGVENRCYCSTVEKADRPCLGCLYRAAIAKAEGGKL